MQVSMMALQGVFDETSCRPLPKALVGLARKPADAARTRRQRPTGSTHGTGDGRVAQFPDRKVHGGT